MSTVSFSAAASTLSTRQFTIRLNTEGRPSTCDMQKSLVQQPNWAYLLSGGPEESPTQVTISKG